MSLNLFEENFITNWKSVDFTDWNESDIREEFIAPLLKILGYAKNTVNSIIREPSLNLQEKYHRIGRKQIAIDYIPTIRLKKFWIIEAKPGNPKEMAFGDLLQAHFYAIHPEINARFIVMINGWEIRVYDAHVANSWDDYILLCTQENCETTFTELLECLGSRSMTDFLRKYILSTVKESLMVEVDVQKAEQLKSDVFKIYLDSLTVIRQNAHDLQLASWKKAAAEENEWLKTLSLEHLYIFMDRPTDARGMYGLEFFRRLQDTAIDGRYDLYKRLMQKCYGRPHHIFKVQCVIILCETLRTNLEITNNGQPVNVMSDLASLVEYNMNYWKWPVGDPIDHIGFALCHLDNICARLAYKFSRRFGIEPLKALVESKLQTFSVEDLLVNSPTVAKEIVGSVRVVHEMLWFRFMAGDSKEIWINIWAMTEIEKLLDQIPQVEYLDGDIDFLWFGNYGIDFDMLRMGTWSELNAYKKSFTELQTDKRIIDTIAMTREQVLQIPEIINPPANWVFPSIFSMDTLFQVLKKLAKMDVKPA